MGSVTNRFRMKTMSGKQSRSLWGPGDGRGAYAPESLSRSQCEGALRRFWCFFLRYTKRCQSQSCMVRLVPALVLPHMSMICERLHWCSRSGSNPEAQQALKYSLVFHAGKSECAEEFP